jgi:hypothetical protein
MKKNNTHYTHLKKKEIAVLKHPESTWRREDAGGVFEEPRRSPAEIKDPK